MIFALLLLAAPLEQGAPTRVSVGPGDFGMQPETTPRTYGMIVGRARLLVDTPNLFGTIGMDAQLRISYALSDRAWFAINLSAIEYRNVINASITATSLALGPLTGSIHYQLYRNERWVITPYARILLPTTTATTYARQLGLEVGVSGSYAAHEMVSWLWGIMLPAGATILSSRAAAFVWPTLATEIAFHPRVWVDLLAGLEVRISPRLEYLAPKLAFRFYPTGGLVLDLKAMFPLLGLERTDYVLGFSGGWIW